MNRLPLLVVLATLAACTETGVNPLVDGTDPEPDPLPDPPPFAESSWEELEVLDTDPPSPVCDPLDTSAGTVETVETCTSRGAPGTFELVAELTISDDPTLAQPVVGPLTDDDGDGDSDADDLPDIATVSIFNDVVVRDAATGDVHWTFDGSGMTWNIQPALADVDADGINDVIAFVGMLDAPPWDASMVALNGNTGEVIWSTVLDRPGFNSVNNAISVGEMDGKGGLEIGYGNAILDARTGELVSQGWGAGMGGPHCESGATMQRATQSLLADLDGDGKDELLAGNAAYGRDGKILWRNASGDGAPVVANFDDDPALEYVATYTWGFCKGFAEVRLHDDDGSELWKVTYGSSSPLTAAGLATVADFDGDGELEIVHTLSDVTRSVGTPDAIVMLEADGTRKWAVDSGDPFDRAPLGPAAAIDIDQDGAYEVVYQHAGGVTILDGRTGDEVAFYAVDSSGGYKSPVVADLDLDGQAEILVATGIWSNPSADGLLVLGSKAADWPATQSVWPASSQRARRNAEDLSLRSPFPTGAAYNHYRAAWHPTFDAPDAELQVIDRCEIECDRDRLLLSWRVGNPGIAPLPEGLEVVAVTGPEDAPVEVARQAVPGAVEPGQTTEGVVLELSPSDLVDGQVRLSLEGDVVTCDQATKVIEVSDICGG